MIEHSFRRLPHDCNAAQKLVDLLIYDKSHSVSLTSRDPSDVIGARDSCLRKEESTIVGLQRLHRVARRLNWVMRVSVIVS